MVNYLKLSFVDHSRARGQVQVFADHCAWTLIDGKAGGQKRGKKEDTDPHTASDFELRSLTSKNSDRQIQVSRFTPSCIDKMFKESMAFQRTPWIVDSVLTVG